MTKVVVAMGLILISCFMIFEPFKIFFKTDTYYCYDYPSKYVLIMFLFTKISLICNPAIATKVSVLVGGDLE